MIIIDQMKCDGCGTCISVCRSDALLLEEKLSCIENSCTDCGFCVKICPFDALRLVTVSKLSTRPA